MGAGTGVLTGSLAGLATVGASVVTANAGTMAIPVGLAKGVGLGMAFFTFGRAGRTGARICAVVEEGDAVRTSIWGAGVAIGTSAGNGTGVGIGIELRT